MLTAFQQLYKILGFVSIEFCYKRVGWRDDVGERGKDRGRESKKEKHGAYKGKTEKQRKTTYLDNYS